MRTGFGASIGQAAATLAREAEAGALRAVALTAGARGEGVTTIAAALGRELAEAFGLRVLLVDAGEGGHRLAALLSQGPVRIGEGEVASTNAAWALVDLGPGTGEAVPALRRRLADVVAAAAGRFDIVLIDAPPMPSGLAARFAARACGAALLVVRAGSLPFEPLREIRDELTDSGVRVIGVVLNARREVVPRWLSRLIQ